MKRMMSKSTAQCGAIVGLVGLILLNLCTLHYIVNLKTNHSPANSIKVSDKSVIETKTEKSIPRIVHLSWKEMAIPGENVVWVKSWKKTNPKWKVWFWTDFSVNEFITKYYPDFVNVFTAYKTPIYRADAMRYFILYHFGGVWADLDVEALKSLEPVRAEYPAILSQESEVHAKSSWRVDMMICNAFMATRARHPFFRFIINMLEVNAKDRHPVSATGPVMLTRMYKAYNQMYEELGSTNHTNKVHIATVNMFLPTVDELALNTLKKRCDQNKLPEKYRYLCDKYLKSHFKNGPTNESYTDHHWWHSWLGKHDYKDHQNIQNIIPDVVLPDLDGKF